MFNIRFTKENLFYSIQDILTDLVVERAPVSFGGVHGYVHTGMYQSAKYIRNRLIADNILDKAFQRAEVGLM